MTAAPALQSLTIAAFRGSSKTLKLQFEKTKKLTLIYGENGTGKTTICDALEFLARDELGSLQGKGLGGGLHKYWLTAGKSGADIVVDLETSSGICSGRLNGSKANVQPTDLRPRVEMLRRQQVLKLVEAVPGERYKEVQRFIDIEGFERSEDALRQLIKNVISERVSAANAELQAVNTLTSSQEIAKAQDLGDPVSWARAELAKPAPNLKADLEHIASVRTAFQLLKALSDRLPTLDAALASAQAKADASDTEFMAAKAKIDDEAERTLGVLEAGLQYLEGHDPIEACPLCESEEKVAGLTARLQERIDAFQAYREALENWRRDGSALIAAKTARGSVETEFEQAGVRFNEAVEAMGSLLERRPPEPPVQLAGLAGWLEAMVPEVERWADLEAAWRQGARFAQTLEEALSVYDAKHDRVAELDGLKPLAEAALAVCVQQRQIFTETLIGGIAKEVGRLYELVHPEEGLDKISFPLDPNQRASLKLSAPFGGEDRPPQAYFSQSHLDTLGVCVFLALAGRERKDETILVLDDVLGSVDEPHVDRVIEMIYDVSDGFRHTIVTTHYRPWREKYRWGLLKPGKPCHFVELTHWGLGEGIRLTNCVPEVDRLAALLAADQPDVQAITAKAGVVLEHSLDHLTRKYECSLPRHDRGYTVGELIDAVSGKLRAALKVERRSGEDVAEIVELGPMLDRLKAICGARNVLGAHFNQLSYELSGSEGLDFARQVHGIADALICPEHGWPTNSSSGSYWRNGGDTRRLHPLRKPG